jgi:probable F420-dependent oxidoreductase
VRIDAKLTWAKDQSLAGFVERGREVEASGYHGLWSAESAHDPFLPLAAAATETSDLQLGTAVTVAFARNPMSLAYTAYDLQTLTGGRFLLGLGSQVQSHVEHRFGMPWSRPASRMREFIEAMRTIWAAWASGDRLDFRGDFYTHTLMTPFFSPPPSPFGPPAVYLAAVGERMTEVAGASCDGLLPHPFTTARYLREHTLPALQRGLGDSGRSREKFSIGLSGLVASGRSEEEMAHAVAAVKRQIAFYASTPAYHGVLKLHGWGDLGSALNTLSRSESEDRWAEMGHLIEDEVLHAFAVVAEPDHLGPAIVDRFGDIVDRFNFYAPYPHDPTLWSTAIQYLA